MNRTAAAASARHLSNFDQAIEAHVPTSSHRPDFNADPEWMAREAMRCPPWLLSRAEPDRPNLLELVRNSEAECQAGLGKLAASTDVQHRPSNIDIAALAAILTGPPKFAVELDPEILLVQNASSGATPVNQQVEGDPQACCNCCTLL